MRLRVVGAKDLENLTKSFKRTVDNLPKYITNICTAVAKNVALEGKHIIVENDYIDTGLMRDSWLVSDTKLSGNVATSEVSNDAVDPDYKRHYTAYNELGTMYMAPRLMLHRAIERTKLDLEIRMAGQIDGYMKSRRKSLWL